MDPGDSKGVQWFLYVSRLSRVNQMVSERPTGFKGDQVAVGFQGRGVRVLRWLQGGIQDTKVLGPRILRSMARDGIPGIQECSLGFKACSKAES